MEPSVTLPLRRTDLLESIGVPSQESTPAHSSAQGLNSPVRNPPEPPEAQEDLASLLAALTRQKVDLRRQQLTEESQRTTAARRAASQIAGRFVGGQAWRRPCALSHEFSKGGLLSVRYLSPLEQQAADRPARTYEHGVSPPFLNTDSTAESFGEPPPLPPGRRGPRDLTVQQQDLEKLDHIDEVMLRIQWQLNARKYRALDFFRTFDLSGDGFASREEFRRGLRKVGIEPSEEEFGLVMSRLDRDGSGDVTHGEFDKALKLVTKKAKAEGRSHEIDTWSVKASTSPPPVPESPRPRPPPRSLPRAAKLDGVQITRCPPTWGQSNATPRLLSPIRFLHERAPRASFSAR